MAAIWIGLCCAAWSRRYRQCIIKRPKSLWEPNEKTAQVISLGGEQAIKLPAEFRVSGEALSIRKDGEAIILEPMKSSHWPESFFQQIRIEDPAFRRPSQGELPDVPSLG